MARWLRNATAALALLSALSPAPASAEPITIALFGVAFASTFLGGVVSFGIAAALSMALSFVAAALFRQPSRNASAATSAPESPSAGRTFNVRQAAGPRVVVYGKRRVAGTYALMRLTNNNQYLHMVLLLAGHECEEILKIQIGEDEYDFVTDFDGDGYLIPYNGFVRVRAHLGASDQAADQDLIDELTANGDSGIWTTEHRLRGICYLYIKLRFGPQPSDANGSPPLFSDGIPNITAVIRGKKDIYDPRTDTTGYSNNPALCLANYLTDTTYGLGVDYATAINETALIAAANACDDEVDLIGGGTEKLYESNGTFESSEQPQTVIGQLLASMHGRAPYDGEKWTIIAGVYQTPTLTFTDDDLRAGMTVGTITSRRDLFNAVKGTFTSPAHNWQEFDFPPVVGSSFVTADGGIVYKDIALPFTTSASMAQRIAKIDLLRARRQITVKAPCKLTAWLCQAGDTIMWTSARWGWTSKPFEVRGVKFTVEEGETGPTLGVDLDLAETAPTIYSWDTTEQQLLDDMPATTLPSIHIVTPPTNLTVTESLYATLSSNGVKTRADLAWAASPDGFVIQYQPEYKLHADSTWHVLARVTGTATTIADLEPGLYDFRVAAVNFAGFVSDYTTHTREISGIGAAPVDATGFTAIVVGGAVVLRWNVSTDLDVLIGGQAVFRFSPAVQFDVGGTLDEESAGDDIIDESGTPLITEVYSVGSTPAWDAASPLGEVAGSATVAVMEAKAGSYLLKFRDATGNYSVNPASVFIDRAELPAMTLLTSLIEDPAFSGTKTNCSVASGILSLDTGEATGTYEWSSVIDLGSVKSVRVTIGTASQVVSTSDLVDNWPDIDSRASWDTAVNGNEAHALTYISVTSDDPGGSPNWTDYQQIDTADFAARAFRLKTILTANDITYGIEISALDAVVEQAA